MSAPLSARLRPARTHPVARLIPAHVATAVGAAASAQSYSCVASRRLIPAHVGAAAGEPAGGPAARLIPPHVATAVAMAGGPRRRTRRRRRAELPEGLVRPANARANVAGNVSGSLRSGPSALGPPPR